jgi:transposase
MKILALDLGKYKSVGCAYESETGAHHFERTLTTPRAIEKLVQEVKPERVVIEICSIVGWVCELLWRQGVEVQVANTNDDVWSWRKVKQKDDRRDALKAARLSAVNQIRAVYIPSSEVRR